MSLCYDFEKWTIISLASIAISLTIGLVLMQFAHGQTETTLEQQKESLQAVLDHCLQHADRPNPVQDLVDKGFLSLNFTGETCISVRQMYDEVETRINEYNKKQLSEYEKRTAEIREHNKKQLAEHEKQRTNDTYMECARNQTITFEECNLIIWNKIK